jgi:hypothetical protein
VLLAAFSALLVATILVRAEAKPFWHDEIYTIVAARLPSIPAIWRAQREGLDLAAPLNILATRAVHAVAGVGRVTTRLSAIAGFWVAEIVIFDFVRRRVNALMGIAGALLACYTAAFRYSYEARGYGLMLGFVALALYAWAEAAAGRRRALNVPLLAMALAGGCWSHYYALFAFVPIGAGELVRSLRRRAVDVPIWAAIAASAIVIAPLWLLTRAAVEQFPTMWRHASWSAVGETYAFILDPSLNLLFACDAIVIIIVSVADAAVRRSGRTIVPAIAAHEAAAIALLVLLPVIDIAAAIAVGGIFVPRYALACVVGLATAVPLLVWRFGDRRGIAQIILAVLLAGRFSQSAYASLSDPPRFVNPVAGRPLFVDALNGPPPVTVTSGLVFLQLWYYTPPAARGRMWFVADPREGLRSTGSDTIDRGFLVLARWTDINVATYGDFVAAHPRFRLYVAGSGWLRQRLLDDHAALQVTGREPGGTMIDVEVR